MCTRRVHAHGTTAHQERDVEGLDHVALARAAPCSGLRVVGDATVTLLDDRDRKREELLDRAGS